MAEADALPTCWKLKKCGREKGGDKVGELGECVASTENLGHSCWVIAGTLCGGEVQGTFAEKEGTCMGCEVYKLYHRQIGSQGAMVAEVCPEEQAKYQQLLIDRLRELKAG